MTTLHTFDGGGRRANTNNIAEMVTLTRATVNSGGDTHNEAPFLQDKLIKETRPNDHGFTQWALGYT